MTLYNIGSREDQTLSHRLEYHIKIQAIPGQLRCLGSKLRQVLQDVCDPGVTSWYQIRRGETEYKGAQRRNYTEINTEAVDGAQR